MEKEIKRVVFTFDDGSEKVLEGDELDNWAAICLAKSDYLLPGGPDDVLASSMSGLIRGFVPPEAVSHSRSAHLG